MAEATATQEPATSPESQKQTDPSIKDLIAQIELVKSAQSGSDKKVRELTEALTLAKKEKDELLKERMTEREKSQWDLEQREKAMAEKDALLSARTLALDAANVIGELGVPKELAPFVTGSSRDEMVTRAKALMDGMKAAAAKDVNERLVKQGGPAPVTGAPAAAGFTQAQLDDPVFIASQIGSTPPGPVRDKLRERLYAAAAAAQKSGQ